MNTAIAGANLTMSMVNAMDTAAETILFGNQNESDEENNEVPEYVTSNTAHGNSNAIAISVNSQFNNTDEVISVNSSPAVSISSATPAQTINSSSASSEPSVPTSPQSIPVPTSPQSSRSSSKASSTHSHNNKKQK